MSDLIDRAAALEIIDIALNNIGYVNQIEEARTEIEKLPTVPAVPIRRTTPVMGVSRDQMRNWWQCGNCESVIDQGDRYCRGCGAEVEWDGGK